MSAVLNRVCKRLYSLTIAENTISTQALIVKGFQSSSVLLRATEGEDRIAAILTRQLQPTYLQVHDISGGCGSMYEITIDSKQFEGKRVIQQHRMVNEALKDEVPSLHGLTIRIGNPTNDTSV